MSLLATAGVVAGSSALTLLNARRREAAWRHAFPPEGHFVPVEGRRIHLHAAGPADRPAVVLIHGANGNLRDFTFDLVARLAGPYRVISVDRPGMGWSDSWGEADSDPMVQARVLRQAVATSGVTRPVVLGHSYGGSVAMAWALQDPQTAGLVLLAGATHPWTGHSLGAWYAINDTPLGRPARALAAGLAPRRMIDASLASVFAPAPVPDGYAQHFGPGLALRRQTQAANTRQVNALLRHLTRMQPRYAGLRLPIEVLHGDADTIVGIDIHARKLVADVPSARLTVLRGAGHMPHHSHTEAVLDAVRRVTMRAGSEPG
ncbi:MAG: alpha/beta hydrolase [Rhodobacter sp.]|nr:alpha/beta hydrolase [Paracoccaceae bacterium]MCC0078732.1 alpha/beta hydrolase [Rhodobacter sp.]